MSERQPRPEVDFAAWLLLRGAVDGRELVRLKGKELAVWVAAQHRAEEMRVEELRQAASFLAEALGAKKAGGSSG